MATAVPKPAEVDPFIDEDFAPLDTRTGADHIAALDKLALDHPELVPAQPTPTPAPVAEDQPETFEVEGGVVTIQKTKSGWEGILELDEGGGKETFRGTTKNDLMVAVLRGKLNATKQIRKLNKKLKMGTPTDAPIQPTEPVINQPKQLNANDIFEIKTALEADPDKAFELWFQKKFNLSASQLVQIAQEAGARSKKGEEAYEELTIEGVSKAFLEAHKEDYYPWAENGQAIAHWLCKNKLRRNPRTGEDFGPISSELLKKGLYTVENLEEAFEDLRDSGLLEPPPQPEIPEEVIEEEPVTPTPRVAVPAPVAPQPSRIVSTRRQPRGGLGIRPSTVHPTQVDEPRAPSADELENMSTQELSELLKATYKHARSARR